MDRYDFCGWATKNNLLCADGRTIRKDAFKENDGQTVPLVWMHQHNEPFNVLGHALLENRDDGVYTYGFFNDTPEANTAKSLLKHGDITGLSIYANQLKQKGGDVLHGTIREVSLVLAGANPEAKIEFVDLVHSEDGEEDEAVIQMAKDECLLHAYQEEEKKKEEPKKEEPKMAEANEKTVKDVFDELTDEQKNVVYFMIGKALEDAGVDTGNDKEEKDVKHNVFENDTPNNTLSHADFQSIMSDAKRCGSLKEAVENSLEDGVLAHANGAVVGPDSGGAYSYTLGDNNTYGVAPIDWLFPEYRNLNNTPEFIRRPNEWVSTVMGGVHRTPFSRIKSMFANITMDEARAKGYVKGNLKTEEVFSLLKRATDPQTIYKKQKMDRDDIIDITDFDVVAWLKGEMRTMLDEEIARAILVGDGRLTSDDDHISHDHVRPIWTDSDLFTIKKTVDDDEDPSKKAKNFIRAAIKARKDYRGSGNPILFTTEDMLTDLLLIEDGIGHLLYQSEAQLATALRVSKIVTVPVMENLTRTVSGDTHDLMGIIVNLADYNVGADKGGAVQMFDDFDIDYNQQKYLIETRCSGALVKPYSAIVLECVESGT